MIHSLVFCSIPFFLMDLSHLCVPYIVTTVPLGMFVTVHIITYSVMMFIGLTKSASFLVLHAVLLWY